MESNTRARILSSLVMCISLDTHHTLATCSSGIYIRLPHTRLRPEVALGIMPGRIVNERLAEKHFDLVVGPPLRRERLEEHDDALARVSFMT